jgi:NADH-quinone oxidoreductase subunit C
MVDFDIRLGLSPADLVARNVSNKRPDDWIDLSADDDVELRLLLESFPGQVVKSRLFRDEKTIWVKRDRIVDICFLLRNSDETRFNFVSDLTCVDLLKMQAPSDERFEVVYNLYSLATFKRLRLKAIVPESDPSIDTVEIVWPAANWLEREIYDLFGLTFNNHSDLRRIQMPDDWIGHPLRKDYPIGGEQVEFSFNVRKS